MQLKPTQFKVLEVLVKNKDKWLGSDEIYRLSKVQKNHIDSAVIFLWNNGYAYDANIDGKIKVTPDGINLYYECL
ncbi:hypothetical protein ACQQ2T_07920 [Paraclostridium tenue]